MMRRMVGRWAVRVVLAGLVQPVVERAVDGDQRLAHAFVDPILGAGADGVQEGQRAFYLLQDGDRVGRRHQPGIAYRDHHRRRVGGHDFRLLRVPAAH